MTGDKEARAAAADPKHRLLFGFGAGVRARRRVAGWSRRELAGRSGVSERFLAEIESGRGNPSLSRMHDLAVALGTTPAELLQEPAIAAGTGSAMIALLGLRGAGKSSVGKRLAEALGWRFVELDAVVEEQSGLGLNEMFELHGEPYYRRMERQALQSLLAAGESIVLSTGGGLVTEPATFDLLQSNARTVWLRATPEDHWARVVAQGDTRPMQGHDEAFAHLRAILEERVRLYERADVTIDTSGTGLAGVCEKLVSLFAPED